MLRALSVVEVKLNTGITVTQFLPGYKTDVIVIS